MSLNVNNEVLATDINALKNQVVNEIRKRTKKNINGVDELANYRNLQYSQTPAENVSLLTEHYNQIAAPILAINNTSKNITNVSLPSNVNANDLVNAITSLKTLLDDFHTHTEDYNTYDCRIQCTGYCSSCSDSCTGGCNDTCVTGCKTTCEGKCDQVCNGSCSGGCQGTCGGECTGGCTSSCTGGCTSTCGQNLCTNACGQWCTGTCKTGCLHGCRTTCNGCISTCAGTVTSNSVAPGPSKPGSTS